MDPLLCSRPFFFAAELAARQRLARFSCAGSIFSLRAAREAKTSWAVGDAPHARGNAGERSEFPFFRPFLLRLRDALPACALGLP
jgi:hypothetical protein